MNCSEHIFTPIGDRPIMWIMLIFMPLVTIFGLIGNFASFIILKDSSAKVSSCLYIRCLTIFDSLSLIFTIFGYYAVFVVHPMLIDYPPYRKISYIWIRWGACQFRTYLAYSSRTLSIWTIVIFTLERFICIKYPIWSIKLCTVRNAKRIMGISVIISLLLNITWIFSFVKVNCVSSGVSVCKNLKSMLIFRILDMVMLSLIPAAIIIICNIVMILTLKKRRQLSLLAYEDSLNKQRDNKITLQLLVVSSTFTLLTIPQFISVIINTYHEKHSFYNYRRGHLANFYHISFLLFTLNFSTNFVLYCFVGKNFRNAAKSIFLCRLEQMKVLRRAIFESVSSDAKHTVIPRSNANTIIVQTNEKINLDMMHKEKNPLLVTSPMSTNH